MPAETSVKLHSRHFLTKVVVATKKNSGARSRADSASVSDRTASTVALIEEGGKTVRVATMVAGFCFGAWCVKEIAAGLAGQITNANIALNVLGNLEFSITASWVLAAGAGAYGFSQNRLRKKTVKHLHGRIAQYEKIIDPNRTSSRLSDTGDTNPEDS